MLGWPPPPPRGRCGASPLLPVRLVSPASLAAVPPPRLGAPPPPAPRRGAPPPRGPVRRARAAARPPPGGSPPPAEAREVSAQMQGAWTAFAGDGAPGWAPYDVQQLTRVFDAGERGGVRPYPEEASWKLWADAPPEVLDLQ